MKLMRFIQSLRNRGVLGSADLALSSVQERLFDLYYGTDTVAFVGVKAVLTKSPNASEGTGYQPTRLRPLRRVLQAMKPAPPSVFVDYGCGKGRALLVAAECGFQKVVGIEFASDLCAIARCNIAKYLGKTRLNSDIQVVETDAAEYIVQDDQSYFFFFNPFRANVMTKVIQRIADSLARANRQVFIIYNNPIHGDVLEQQGFLPTRELENSEIILYANKLQSP